ncbi:IS1595 family transposase [Polaromonas hydrogenivorans]|uniref:IS1595 family transposase n=1 Tax=Polaromonas hydrogenivorans TaxID=335476 RepID=A0AAU7LZZ3_9BURK
MNAETFNGVMQQVSRLTLRQRELLKKRLDELDGQQEGLAVIESQNAARACPHCHGTELFLHGQANGLQRYRCRACRHTFNALTGTALARLRKKGKWLGFSAALVASQPLRPAAATLGIHRNTALRWRHRFLSALKADRAATLQGITEADETYFLESHKGCRKLQRAPRRRGGKASKPGLSGELVCVLVARDRARQTLDWVTGTGQMSKAQLSSALQPVLARDTLLVSDGNPTYRYFAQEAAISHDAINLSAGVHAKGAVHIQNVNAYHGRLKQWLNRFHGVATHYLDNYLGWFRCLDSHHATSRKGVLAMALGKFPHLTVT